ncbi:MAG: hypothetical protein WCC27_03045 [Acidobacteriaceae bacterium]
MRSLCKLSLGSALLAFLASPAFAGVTVNSPGNGAQVSSPFTLSASATSCSSQPVAAMGYSFDSSTNTTVLYATSIDTSVSSATGSHTLHVKAWGNQGASCVTDVALNVGNVITNILSIPSEAIGVSSIQALGGWIGVSDSSASGSSSGRTGIVGWPSLLGSTRQFTTNFKNSGDERYYANFGDDMASTNFFYDAYIYLNNTSSKIGVLEMDLNQVMANGQTVIMGFQCDGWTSTWDYTENAGTPTKPVDAWVHSNRYCNPRTWSTYVWHHVQISYSRNSSGQVTYNAVWLDNLEMPINATVPSAFALGWAPVLNTNFQVDGYGSSGSSTVFVDGLTVYRW